MDYAFRSGKFVLLLDGLDELAHTLRDECCRQILEITYKFPNCLYLITSRPDDRFSSWQEFYVGTMSPFTKEQVVELVKKIDFDHAIKNSFITDISNRLYQSHKEFLSNPLLCTMMLMTYNEFEEIPSKMYIFYDRAFEVLFTRPC